MASIQKPGAFSTLLNNQLPLMEKVFLFALGAGAILAVLNIDNAVVKVALLALGLTFFLMAYRPVDLPIADNEPFGFLDLLGLTIVPKVLWISSAVSALGVAFYLFQLGNDGYKKMLMVGGLTIAIGTVLILLCILNGVKHIKMVTPVLLRAVPLCVIDFYLLYK